MWLENAIADLRIAARSLRKNPVYTIAAALTLALGIGANTAIFSVINSVFLRPLPYLHPERLVWTTEYYPKFKRTQMFTPEYAAWKGQNTAFESLQAYGISIGMNLAGDRQTAKRVQVGHVTPGFFQMLGVQPQAGRLFRPEENQASRKFVALISDALWRNYFQDDRRVLEKTIVLDGAAFSIIGVLPPGFQDLAATDTSVWLPDAVNSGNSLPGRSMNLLSGVIGRLKRGVTVDQARANLVLIARRMDNQYPIPWSTYHTAARVRVLPLQQQLTSGSKKPIYVLAGAVSLILLIACANVANIFLSRALARRREIAIRASLGAPRSRVVRLFLTESLLLAICGGSAGLIFMYGGVSALAFLLPTTVPARIPIDTTVLCFAFFCSVATGIAFGLLPALAVARLDLNTNLKEGSVDLQPHRNGFRFRSSLAVTQLALSLILLVGAGLLLRSLFALLNVNPGFNPHNVLLAEISLAPHELYGPERQVQFFSRLLEVAARIPGTEQVAVTDESPLATFQSLASGLAAEGEPPSDATVVPTSISAGYFKALETPLLAGRFFNDGDREGSRRVVIINQALARILFPNRNPLGRRIRFGDAKDPWVTVVGVVADIRHRSLDDKTWAELFQPYQQAPAGWMSLVVKTSFESSHVIPAIRRTVAAIDRNQALFNVESLDQRLSDSVAERRRRAFLLALFAVVALSIAAAGMYGVVAYSVTRRTHEIGIRIALGAQKHDVLALVLAEVFKLSLAGIAVGIAGALALTRFISSFLYRVTATDSTTFVLVSLLLAFTACAAAWIPARRAAKVDPQNALRQE